MIKVTEQVLDAMTGDVFHREAEAPLDDGGRPFVWYWSDGNMECDCNRGEVCGVDDAPCNALTRRFLLNLLDENRDVIYREFELPLNATRSLANPKDSSSDLLVSCMLIR